MILLAYRLRITGSLGGATGGRGVGGHLYGDFHVGSMILVLEVLVKMHAYRAYLGHELVGNVYYHHDTFICRGVEAGCRGRGEAGLVS